MIGNATASTVRPFAAPGAFTPQRVLSPGYPFHVVSTSGAIITVLPPMVENLYCRGTNEGRWPVRMDCIKPPAAAGTRYESVKSLRVPYGLAQPYITFHVIVGITDTQKLVINVASLMESGCSLGSHFGSRALVDDNLFVLDADLGSTAVTLSGPPHNINIHCPNGYPEYVSVMTATVCLVRIDGSLQCFAIPLATHVEAGWGAYLFCPLPTYSIGSEKGTFDPSFAIDTGSPDNFVMKPSFVLRTEYVDEFYISRRAILPSVMPAGGGICGYNATLRCSTGISENPEVAFQSVTLRGATACGIAGDGSMSCVNTTTGIPSLLQSSAPGFSYAVRCVLNSSTAILANGSLLISGRVKEIETVDGAFATVLDGTPDGWFIVHPSQHLVSPNGVLIKRGPYTQVSSGTYLAKGSIGACALNADGSVECYDSDCAIIGAAPLLPSYPLGTIRIAASLALDMICTIGPDPYASSDLQQDLLRCFGQTSRLMGKLPILLLQPMPAGSIASIALGSEDILCVVRSDSTLACYGKGVATEWQDKAGAVSVALAPMAGFGCQLSNAAPWMDCFGVAASASMPLSVTDFPTVPLSSIAVADTCVCSLLAVNGSVWCACTASASDVLFNAALSAGLSVVTAPSGQSTSLLFTQPVSSNGLCSGPNFICMVLPNMKVVCLSMIEPAPAVVTLAPSGAFTTISCGRAHACGVRTGTQETKCWGSNEDVPLQVASSGALAVYASASASCAVLTTGAFNCWGVLSAFSPAASPFSNISNTLTGGPHRVLTVSEAGSDSNCVQGLTQVCRTLHGAIAAVTTYPVAEQTGWTVRIDASTVVSQAITVPPSMSGLIITSLAAPTEATVTVQGAFKGEAAWLSLASSWTQLLFLRFDVVLPSPPCSVAVSVTGAAFSMFGVEFAQLVCTVAVLSIQGNATVRPSEPMGAFGGDLNLTGIHFHACAAPVLIWARSSFRHISVTGMQARNSAGTVLAINSALNVNLTDVTIANVTTTVNPDAGYTQLPCQAALVLNNVYAAAVADIRAQNIQSGGNGSLICGVWTYTRTASMSLVDVHIKNSSAALFGGVAFFQASSTVERSFVSIKRHEIVNSWSGGGGGSVAAFGIDRFAVSDSIIDGSFAGTIEMQPAPCSAVTPWCGAGGVLLAGANGLKGSVASVFNVTAHHCSASSDGGAFAIYDYRNVHIATNHIYECTSRADGGGVSIKQAVSAAIVNTTCTGCTASSDGGGLFVADVFMASVTGSNFSNCTAALRGGGAALLCGMQSLLLSSACTLGVASTNVSFSVAGEGGGGIFVQGGNINSSVLVTGSIFEGNVAGIQGGGLLYEAGPSTFASSIMENCTITGCRCTVGSCIGGGVAMVNSASNSFMPNLAVKYTTLSQCDSAGSGGGLAIGSSVAVVTAVNVTRNSAAVFGGGVYVYGSQVMAQGMHVIGNAAGDSGGGIMASACALRGFSVEQTPELAAALVLANNTALSSGGGILFATCRAKLSHVVVFGNVAAVDGGGVHVIGADAVSPPQLIAPIIALSNTAIRGSGGWLSVVSSRASITLCVSPSSPIAETSASAWTTWVANQLHVLGASSLSLQLSHACLCVVARNSAPVGSGGDVSASSAGTNVRSVMLLPVIAISGVCSVQSTARDGGSMWLSSSNVVVVNVTFTATTATRNGGAIAMSDSAGVSIDGSNATTFDNVIFERIRATYGGALWLSGVAGMLMRRLVFSDCFADRAGGSLYVKSGAVPACVGCSMISSAQEYGPQVATSATTIVFKALETILGDDTTLVAAASVSSPVALAEFSVFDALGQSVVSDNVTECEIAGARTDEAVYQLLALASSPRFKANRGVIQLWPFQPLAKPGAVFAVTFTCKDMSEEASFSSVEGLFSSSAPAIKATLQILPVTISWMHTSLPSLSSKKDRLLIFPVGAATNDGPPRTSVQAQLKGDNGAALQVSGISCSVSARDGSHADGSSATIQLLGDTSVETVAGIATFNLAVQANLNVTFELAVSCMWPSGDKIVSADTILARTPDIRVLLRLGTMDACLADLQPLVLAATSIAKEAVTLWINGLQAAFAAVCSLGGVSSSMSVQGVAETLLHPCTTEAVQQSTTTSVQVFITQETANILSSDFLLRAGLVPAALPSGTGSNGLVPLQPSPTVGLAAWLPTVSGTGGLGLRNVSIQLLTNSFMSYVRCEVKFVDYDAGGASLLAVGTSAGLAANGSVVFNTVGIAPSGGQLLGHAVMASYVCTWFTGESIEFVGAPIEVLDLKITWMNILPQVILPATDSAPFPIPSPSCPRALMTVYSLRTINDVTSVGVDLGKRVTCSLAVAAEAGSVRWLRNSPTASLSGSQISFSNVEIAGTFGATFSVEVTCFWLTGEARNVVSTGHAIVRPLTSWEHAPPAEVFHRMTVSAITTRVTFLEPNCSSPSFASCDISTEQSSSPGWTRLGAQPDDLQCSLVTSTVTGSNGIPAGTIISSIGASVNVTSGTVSFHDVAWSEGAGMANIVLRVTVSCALRGQAFVDAAPLATVIVQALHVEWVHAPPSNTLPMSPSSPSGWVPSVSVRLHTASGLPVQVISDAVCTLDIVAAGGFLAEAAADCMANFAICSKLVGGFPTASMSTGTGLAVFERIGVESDFGTYVTIRASCSRAAGGTITPAYKNVSITGADLLWVPVSSSAPAMAGPAAPLSSLYGASTRIVFRLQAISVFQTASTNGILCSMLSASEGNSGFVFNAPYSQSDDDGFVEFVGTATGPIRSSGTVWAQCSMGSKMVVSTSRRMQVDGVTAAWKDSPPTVWVPSAPVAGARSPLIPHPSIVLRRNSSGNPLDVEVAITCTVTAGDISKSQQLQQPAARSCTLDLLEAPSGGFQFLWPGAANESSASAAALSFTNLMIQASKRGCLARLSISCVRSGGEQLPALSAIVELPDIQLAWLTPPTTTISPSELLSLQVVLLRADSNSNAEISTDSVVTTSLFWLDNTTVCTLSLEPSMTVVLQNNLATSSAGVVTFDGVRVSAPAGISLKGAVTCSFPGMSSDTSRNLFFNLQIRACPMGTAPSGYGCLVCAAGTFSLGGSNATCQACPVSGATCSGGLIALTPGYFRVDGSSLQPALQPFSENTELLPCLMPEACIVNSSMLTYGTGNVNSGAEGQSISTHTCAPGYTGPLCGVCSATGGTYGLGYAKVAGACTPCNSSGANVTIFALIVAILFSFAAWVACARKNPSPAEFLEQDRTPAITVRICITYVQMVGTIASTFISKGTHAFASILGSASTIPAASVTSTPQVQCLWRPSLYASFITTVSMPLLLVIFVSLLQGMGAVCAHITGKRPALKRIGQRVPGIRRHYTQLPITSSKPDKCTEQTPKRYVSLQSALIGAIVLIFNLTFASVTNGAFSLLNCLPYNIGGVKYSSVDMNLSCDSTTHRLVSLGAWIVLIGFSVGFPLLLAWRLTANRTQLHTSTVIERYGFLFAGYDSARGLIAWESLVMLRKVGLGAFGSIIKDPYYQLASAILLCGSALVLQVHWRPYASTLLNTLELIAQGGVILTIVISLYALRIAQLAADCAAAGGGRYAFVTTFGARTSCSELAKSAPATEVAVTTVLLLVNFCVIVVLATVALRTQLVRLPCLRKRCERCGSAATAALKTHSPSKRAEAKLESYVNPCAASLTNRQAINRQASFNAVFFQAETPTFATVWNNLPEPRDRQESNPSAAQLTSAPEHNDSSTAVDTRSTGRPV